MNVRVFLLALVSSALLLVALDLSSAWLFAAALLVLAAALAQRPRGGRTRP